MAFKSHCRSFVVYLGSWALSRFYLTTNKRILQINSTFVDVNVYVVFCSLGQQLRHAEAWETTIYVHICWETTMYMHICFKTWFLDVPICAR